MLIICNNNHTLHFIAPQGSLDQPNTQEFTKYIRQSSPAPLLELARKRSWCSDGRRCDSHCNSGTGWSLYLQPEPQAASRGWR